LSFDNALAGALIAIELLIFNLFYLGSLASFWEIVPSLKTYLLDPYFSTSSWFLS